MRNLLVTSMLHHFETIENLSSTYAWDNQGVEKLGTAPIIYNQRLHMDRQGLRTFRPVSHNVSTLRGAFSPVRSNLSAMRARGFEETGLKASYPKEVACYVMDSSFGSRYRGDGSLRSQRFYHGYHGGIDISVSEGTPILAVASGKVVAKHKGENIGGIAIILQHSPQDTGLPVWTYTEYKHLKELPNLNIGQRVAIGERIALAGKTGTEGPHYGSEGHSHLHLTAWYSDNSGFIKGKMFIPKDGFWMDPLALFRGMPVDTKSVRELPAGEKVVLIPYKTADGRLVPENTSVVWPFECSPQ